MFIAYWKNKKQENKEGRKMRRGLAKGLIILTLVFASTFAVANQKAMAFDIWQTVEKVIKWSYGALGKLGGQTTTITSSGVALDGTGVPYRFEQKTTNQTTINSYGQPIISQSVTETTNSYLDKDILNYLNIDQGALEKAGKPYSWSKQTINYFYDDNGNLMGANGTEEVKGREKPFYLNEKELAFHKSHDLNENDILPGAYDYDRNGDGKIEGDEKNLKLVKGGEYSGTYKLEFTIIDGEAMVSRRVGDINYKNSVGQTRFDRNIVTEYKYGIVAGKVVVTDTWTTQKDVFPTKYHYTDEKGETKEIETNLFQTQYIHTKYEYSKDGSLAKVSGAGYGWGLVNTGQNGYMVYTSDISIAYTILNGVERQTEFKETQYFAPAQNAPDPIANPPRPRDPQGTVIGKFYIRSDSVANGNLNAGQYNEYVWLVVRVDLRDGDKDGSPSATGDGNPDNDKVYLVRVRTYQAERGQADDHNLHPEFKDIAIGSSIAFDGAALETHDIKGELSPHRIWMLTGSH